MAATTTDTPGPLNVNVTTGSDIVCTITNTRETGKLEVKKNLIPTNDPGLFDLQIDGVTDPDADGVGHNGTTGEKTLNTGTHTVGEAAGNGATDLADYDKSIVCVDTANANQQVAATSTDTPGPLNVTVTTGSDIVCTITNTREQAPTAQLTVIKHVVNDDGGTAEANAVAASRD